MAHAAHRNGPLGVLQLLGGAALLERGGAPRCHVQHRRRSPRARASTPAASSSTSSARCTTDGWDTHTEIEITAADGEAYDYFGYSVAIDGNTIVVGAPGTTDRTTGLPEDRRRAYVYRTTDGWASHTEIKLAADDADLSRQQERLKREAAWDAKQPKARQAKSKSRAAAYEELRDANAENPLATESRTKVGIRNRVRATSPSDSCSSSSAAGDSGAGAGSGVERLGCCLRRRWLR